MKAGYALSPKDRLWASFLVRYQQYIPCRKNWSDVKIGSGLGFPNDGVSICIKMCYMIGTMVACPPPMQKVAGWSLPCAFILMKMFLNEFVVNYIRYIYFRVLGLILDETNMSPTFSLRLIAVIMASGNTFGNFSCRSEKWFLTTFDAVVAKPEYRTTNWSECHSLKNAAARICSINAAARSWANFRQRSQSSNSKYYRQYGSPKAQWTIYWTQVPQLAQPGQLVQLRAANAASAARAPIRSTIGSMGPQKPKWTIYWTQLAQPAQLVQLRAANAASAARAPNRSTIGSMGLQIPHWIIYWTQVAQPVQLVQLRAARAPIRRTIGSMGPQKPNEQYIERRWRSWRSQGS